MLAPDLDYNIRTRILTCNTRRPLLPPCRTLSVPRRGTAKYQRSTAMRALPGGKALFGAYECDGKGESDGIFGLDGVRAALHILLPSSVPTDVSFAKLAGSARVLLPRLPRVTPQADLQFRDRCCYAVLCAAEGELSIPAGEVDFLKVTSARSRRS